MKKLTCILIAGIVLRLVLNNSIYSRDAYSFILWTHYLTQHSLVDLYKQLPEGYLTYPPIYYYILMPIGGILTAFNLWQNQWLSYMLVKLPVFFADTLTTLLIYRFTRSFQKERYALWSATFYFLHPAIIYNTSVWGQIDSVIIFLGLLSISLFLKKRFLFALAIFVVSMLTKLQSLALLPLMASLSFLSLSLKQLVKFGSTLTFLTLIVFLPVLTNESFMWTVKYFAAMPNQYPYTSVYAYNLWAPVGFIVSDKTKFLSLIEYRHLGIIIFFLIAGIIVIPLWKKKFRTTRTIVFAAYLLFFNFAYFSTRIHSRYLIYTIGFFAPFIGIFPTIGMLLSVLIIANLLLPESNPLLLPVVHWLNQPIVITLFVLFGFLLFVLSLRAYRRVLLGTV